ncbi:hypothetical protein MPER_10515, partial [Moniliophthora perniciosa FA553]
MSVDGNGLGGTVTGTCIEAKSVMTIPLSSLRDSTLDLATGATECRFRVVDCSSFIECNELRVLEFQDVPWKLGPNPPLSYATISYVWRGNPRPPGEDASSELPANFNVTGAEDGDPIGLDALHHACIVSMRYGISYIWLDRLCILQTSKVDKSWQIQRMAEIYRQTTLCIVLPGGITRLVSLDEPTTWIHRAWTLQESILPSQSLVLFAWGYAETAKVYSKSSSEWDCQIVPVVGGISATIPLTSLLHHHHSRNASIIHKGDQQQFSPKIFGSGNEGRMPAHALASAMQQDILDGHEQAIWRCALMRTSSRPVDMVFSIMGMFGVTLDPRSFKKDDRVGATIALAREILRRGGKANWLGGTLRITPSNELSWAPQFPLSAVDSLPRVEMQNGLRDVRDMLFAADYDSWIEGLPTGKVNEDGAFKFTTRAVSLVSTTHTWFFKPEPFHCAEAGELLVRAKDGSIWKIQDDALDATSQETFSEHVRRTKPGNLPPLKPPTLPGSAS